MVACLGALLLYVPFGTVLAETYLAFTIAEVVITIRVASLLDTLTWRVVPHGVTHSLVGGAIVGALAAAPRGGSARNHRLRWRRDRDARSRCSV